MGTASHTMTPAFLRTMKASNTTTPRSVTRSIESRGSRSAADDARNTSTTTETSLSFTASNSLSPKTWSGHALTSSHAEAPISLTELTSSMATHTTVCTTTRSTTTRHLNQVTSQL